MKAAARRKDWAGVLSGTEDYIRRRWAAGSPAPSFASRVGLNSPVSS